AAAHDFNGDCTSDILFYNTSTGQVVNLLLNGANVVGGNLLGSATSPWAVVGQRDFNGDGTSDILWRNGSTGELVLWSLNGPDVLPFPDSRSLGTVTTDWAVAGTGDFDGDGLGDILWFNSTTRQSVIWFMHPTPLPPTGVALSLLPPTPWTIA